MVVTRSRDMGEVGDAGQSIQSCSYRRSFRHPMYSMMKMTTVINTVLYVGITWFSA